MKRFLILLLIGTFFFLFTDSAKAISIESQSDKADASQIFVVLADEETESSAIQLRLEVEGGIITGFTTGNEGSLSIGTCDADYNKYTETRICVDIASVRGYFTPGDVLGVFNVTRDTEYGQLKVYKSDENAYMLSDGSFNEDTGLAFTLYGDLTEKSEYTKTESAGTIILLVLIGFLTGTVFGTTFTTLGHVLQHGKTTRKN